MRSNDSLQSSVGLEKLLQSSLPEVHRTIASVVFGKVLVSLRIFYWVCPEQVHEEAILWHLNGPLDLIDLVYLSQVG